MYFQIQHDAIEIPKQREQQEAALQSIRDSMTRPLLLRGDGRMIQFTPEQMPATTTRAAVVPFKKRETSPTPIPPAPAQPLRPAARVALTTLALDNRIGGHHGINKLSSDERQRLTKIAFG